MRRPDTYRKRKIILVPTDFSKGATNALNYAIALAKSENKEIVLLHAFHVTYTAPDIPGQIISDNIKATEERINKKLQKLCSEISDVKKVKCGFVSRYGFAVDMILEEAKRIHPDFIVMGTKGASGIKEVLLGSNTAKVIEKAKFPVVAIPEKAKFNGIKNITYATDYHEGDIAALKTIASLAKHFNAHIFVLHAANEELTRETEEELINQFKRKVEKKLLHSDISYGIKYGKQLQKVLQEHIKEEDPGLVAMSTQHRNLIEKLFRSSSAKKMAYHSSTPLLVFHHKKGINNIQKV